MINNYLRHLTFAELIEACFYIVSDNVIQKVKCHFNFASGSQMKANWEKIEEELKFRPPVQLKLEDTELMNGITNGGHAGVHVEVGKLLLRTGDSRLPEPNFANDRKTCNSSDSLCTEKYIVYETQEKKSAFLA